MPYLADAIGKRESSWARWYADHWRKLPAFLRKRLPQPIHPVEIRREAARMLAELVERRTIPVEPVIPKLTRALQDDDSQIRIAAVLMLVRIASQRGSPSAMAGVMKALDLPNTRTWALSGLSRCGPEAKATLPAVLRYLHDPSVAIRRDAALATYEIGGLVDEPVRVLIDALAEHDWLVRGNAVAALATIGPPAKSAVPALLPLLKDQESYPRGWAETALEKIDPVHYMRPPQIQLLMDRLQDPNHQVRADAARQLGQLGPSAKAAVPLLLQVLDQDFLTNSWIMANALYAIDASQASNAVPAMTQYLHNSRAMNRHMAAASLGRMGAAARPAIPALVQGLSDLNHQVRQCCAEALLRIEGPATPQRKSVFAILVDALSPKYEIQERISMAYRLGELGAEAADAVSTLQRAAKDDNEELASTARTALQKISAKVGLDPVP